MRICSTGRLAWAIRHRQVVLVVPYPNPDGVARDGGYVLDASAIVQNDAKIENVRAMTDFARQHGVYNDGHSSPEAPCATSTYQERHQSTLPAPASGARPPGAVVPWDQKRQELGELSGSVPLLQSIWDGVDSLAYTYIWQLLLSF